MKTTTFEPTVCAAGEGGEPADYSGTVTIRLPGITDRCDLQTAYKAALSGFKAEEETAENPDYMRELTRFAATRIAPLFQSATLKRASDGEEFKTWDDLDCEPELVSVVIEALLMLVVGKRRGGGNGGTTS